MGAVVVLGIAFFQFQFDPVRASELAERALREQSKAHDRTDKESTARERREFELRFNALARAFDSFTTTYNDGRGNVFPQKEAVALQKAMDEFQRAHAWKPISRLRAK